MNSSVSHFVVRVQLLLKPFIGYFTKAVGIRITNHCSFASSPSTTLAPAEVSPKIHLPFYDSLVVLS